MMGLMPRSLFSLKSFSNIIVARRYILIQKSSQMSYAMGSSQEKPSSTPDCETRYYRPETMADPYVVTTSKSDVKTRRGEELWWMPDPETGFYRPDTFPRELDAVELRSMHLNGNKKAL
ncbi:hypothetical protein EUTSA_v10010830mg [Eutrema salsugineum]|uniref:Uncharacterized protein n=1 Tax=Eutrema salsugineum TaxID=72664 RepID=V4LYX5_EUTSA|nr:late embryogenesis abundant protein 37 [Eutrema salsugineum]ESQ45108.1 hypothetical protein EUTSA_v10010830mg [Eutrema salsugineum]